MPWMGSSILVQIDSVTEIGRHRCCACLNSLWLLPELVHCPILLTWTSTISGLEQNHGGDNLLWCDKSDIDYPGSSGAMLLCADGFVGNSHITIVLIIHLLCLISSFSITMLMKRKCTSFSSNGAAPNRELPCGEPGHRCGDSNEHPSVPNVTTLSAWSEPLRIIRTYAKNIFWNVIQLVHWDLVCAGLNGDPSYMCTFILARH